MDLLRVCNSVENVKFSAVKKSDWYVEEASAAMQNGQIAYAGKYSAPDYELLLSEGCNLSIQNTMVYHKPEVLEKFAELDIPCLVEKSGYESSPLGRLEWVKLYGAIFGKENEAEAFFNSQIETISPLLNKKTDKTLSVAVFYITKNGEINIRASDDYIARMIEIAGGKYLATKSSGAKATSTLNIQMEEFYALARDADILVYNGIVDVQPKSCDELLKKNPVFADFKAIKQNRVYYVSRDFFQKTASIAQFIKDVNVIISSDKSDADSVYVKKID